MADAPNHKSSKDRQLFVTDDEISDADNRSGEDEQTENDEDEDEGYEIQIDDDDELDEDPQGACGGSTESLYTNPSASYMPAPGERDVRPTSEDATETITRTRQQVDHTLFDDDGYALIPDPPVNDADLGYTTFDGPSTPPKIPRKQANRRPVSQPISASKIRSSIKLLQRRRNAQPDRQPTPRTQSTTISMSNRPLPPLPQQTIQQPSPTHQPSPNPDRDSRGEREIMDNALYEAPTPSRSTPADASEAPRSNRQNTSPSHRVPGSPRLYRPLGFSPVVVGSSDARFIQECLNDAFHGQVKTINTCFPMPAYVLDSLVDPVIAKRAVRCAGLIKPIIRVVILINYYYVGIHRSARARALALNLMSPPTMESLKRKLEPFLPQNTAPAPSPCLRALGRLNVSNSQQKVCCETLDRLLKPKRDPERRLQRMECATNFRGRNLLFLAPRFTLDAAKRMYLANLDIMNKDEGDEDEELKLMITTQTHPTRDAIINDAMFCISLGNAIYSYEQTLEQLRGLIHMELENLSEFLYFAYLQHPRMKDDYMVLSHEMASEVTSNRTEAQGLASVSRRLIAFARRCFETPLFFSPTYIKYLVRCGALEEAGYSGFSSEKSARAFANPELFNPINNEAAARKLLRRTLHFTVLEQPVPNNRRIPTTHIPTHASYDMFIQATRFMTPLRPPPPAPPQESPQAHRHSTFL
ncbi:a25 [Rat cytomegalovirus ALL-03]|uniref:A25 n=2 Tax=Rat cytomegalovirus (isolate England) TaxID=1261657 RepID=A0A0F6TGR2_RCMVE|nr:E25 [Murid betaherpesvirus 8]AKE44200.1 a25 [Rat cytomegalovirus ALL-03]AFX83345.1 E25 [Murid betaherpesvirus 8]WEG71817.1 tegument protein UL25 [Murid betaherpesvirus 8]WPH25207.1 tegument protein UL25 [Murid betaherpesvirus 8]WPH25340.1 tegument protein UL25 [Murid betaherpesvirus 8]